MSERNEQTMAEALRPFGWTCSEKFWRRYYGDPWVFNLANAVERLTERLREADSEPPAEFTAEQRAALAAVTKDYGDKYLFGEPPAEPACHGCAAGVPHHHSLIPDCDLCGDGGIVVNPAYQLGQGSNTNPFIPCPRGCREGR